MPRNPRHQNPASAEEPWGESSAPEPSFWVDRLPVFGDAVLSPMAGFSDLPYRSLCREAGSAMSYTEFVSAQELVQRNNQKALTRLSYLPEERPVVFQIFDNDADRLAEAAARIEPLGPDVIDLNMGCSVRNVSGRGAGAGLLRNPELAGRIIRRLSRTVKVPVTAKIRLGWDRKSQNYLEVAKLLEQSGASLIAVHGRTRDQAYSGTADWDAIAEIVAAVSIPVIGNGDVTRAEDIDRMKAHTGCSAVMIGRAAIGNPWIFQRRNSEEVSLEERTDFMRLHFDRMVNFYGEEQAVILVRKHVARCLKGETAAVGVYRELVRVTSGSEFRRLLGSLAEQSRSC